MGSRIVIRMYMRTRWERTERTIIKHTNRMKYKYIVNIVESHFVVMYVDSAKEKRGRKRKGDMKMHQINVCSVGFACEWTRPNKATTNKTKTDSLSMRI